MQLFIYFSFIYFNFASSHNKVSETLNALVSTTSQGEMEFYTTVKINNKYTLASPSSFVEIYLKITKGQNHVVSTKITPACRRLERCLPR